MAHEDAPPTPRWSTTTYRLQVQGRLPAMLAKELAGFTVDAGPTTTLTGPVSDPAALYGLIARLECLGLTLLSVHPNPQPTAAQPPLLADRHVAHPNEDHNDA
jgi:hypothetical protein